MPTLSAMFDKDNLLLQASNHVFPKSGASDGSFIVAGHGNTFHFVTPGKSSAFNCDKNCGNYTTSICEHVLAVAQVQGTLKEFFTCYKKSKKVPQLFEMTLGSGPKECLQETKQPLEDKQRKTNRDASS